MENEIIRRIFVVVSHFSPTFRAISRKFGLLFGQCITCRRHWCRCDARRGRWACWSWCQSPPCCQWYPRRGGPATPPWPAGPVPSPAPVPRTWWRLTCDRRAITVLWVGMPWQSRHEHGTFVSSVDCNPIQPSVFAIEGVELLWILSTFFICIFEKKKKIEQSFESFVPSFWIKAFFVGICTQKMF